MIAQRVGVAALRRGAAKPNVFFTQTLPKVALTAGMSTTPARPSSMAKLSQEDGQKILVNQRLNRPVSPHLGIYKLEQTWFGTSAWNRITGCTLSAALYGYMAVYLVAPLAGLHLESASVAATFGSLPFIVKGGLKFTLGFPFAYHVLAGFKHLAYDLGKGFAKSTILKADFYLWSASIVGGLILAFAV
ncbi:Fc.00g047120.m01.CDS01 [Cosmosporella sp. VM-42]